jgi:uncharacterized protein YjbI with pentapeptide repeats
VECVAEGTARKSHQISRSDSTLEAADLSKAVFANVVLKGASLARAVFQRTVLDCHLSDVRGLDDTTHRGASHITTAALASLKVPLPERFLRGIGLHQEARLRRSADWKSRIRVW